MKSNGKGKSKAIDPDLDNVDDMEFETQGFEAQNGDSDVLWDVIKILAEKNGKFLLKWAGTDSDGNPWPDSWVPRQDVTDDLVSEWKAKKAAAKREKGHKKKERKEWKGKGTTKNSRIASKESPSTPSTKRSTRQSTTGRPDSISTIATARSLPLKKRKKLSASEAGDSSADDERLHSRDSPRKKRKVESLTLTPAQVTTKTIQPSKVKSPMVQEEVTTIYDKLPTPPRRTSSKSQRESSRASGVVSSKSTTLDQRPGVNETGKQPMKRSKPRSSITQQDEDMEGGNREPATRAPSPASQPGPTSSRATRQHSESRISPTAASSPNIPAENNFTSFELEEKEIDDVLPPSKWRGRGVVSRMKRKGRIVDVDTSESGLESLNSGKPKEKMKPKSRTATAEPEDLEGNGNVEQKRRSLSLAAAPSSQPLFLPNYEGEETRLDLGGSNDDGGTFEFNLCDQEVPLSQLRETTKAETPIKTVNQRVEEVERESMATTESVLPSSDAIQDRHLDNVQVSGDTVIPATQSQSQSQSNESAQPDSLLENSGSSAPIAETDVLMVAEPISSLEVEVESIEVTSPFFTAPSSTVGTNAKRKELKPIPVVSPSKFKPHIPVLKPLSAIPPVELACFRQNGAGDVDALTSSIENQDSPVKDFDGDMHGKKQGSGTRHVRDVEVDDDDIEDSMPLSFELRQRGLELTELHRKKMRQTRRELAIPRISLDAALDRVMPADRTRSGSESREGPPVPEDAAIAIPATEPTHDYPDFSPNFNQGTFSHHEDDDVEAHVRQFEEEYIDFDGNAGTCNRAERSPDGTTGGAQEELHDKQRVVVHKNGALEADAESSSLHEDLEDENDPFISGKSEHRRVATPTETTTSQQDEELAPPYTPERFKILGSPHKFDVNVVETPTRQLNSALGLLNRKSEEIAALKALNARGEKERLAQLERIAELEAETTVLKKTFQEQSQLVASTDADENELSSLKQTHELVLKERDALLAEVPLLKMARDDVENNATLFRELYGKASTFADELRRENVDLKESLALAESQLKNGLGLIRLQSAAQVQKLTEELNKTKILLHVFQEKDQRTDNEVRQRAAREAELQPLVDELREEKREVKSELSTVIRQRNESLVQNKNVSEELERARAEKVEMHNEIRRLKVELARFGARERETIKMFEQTLDGVDNDGYPDIRPQEPDEEEVYVCAWRVDDRLERCGKLLASQQDLRDHLFLAGHL